MESRTLRKTMASVLLAALFLSSAASCADLRLIPSRSSPQPSATPEQVVEGPVDGYLALAPRVLLPGQAQVIPVSLFSRQRPAAGSVEISLYKGTQRLAHAEGQIEGHGELAIDVPPLDEGSYELVLAGPSFQARSEVTVQDSSLVFVETDKPIYKPGQVLHIRVLSLDSRLRPLPKAVTVEVADAKGTKIYRKDVETDDYGMASTDLPISPEPNLGVWKVTAQAGKRTSQVDVRVEHYVLPKYEIKVNLAREWVLPSEGIRGTVSAEYSYGKPVKGELEIVAKRYVGTWEEFARVTRDLDGQLDFELPPVGYVSGVPAAKGMGNVQLEVTVRERSTGYEEKSTSLVTVAADPLVLSVIPESVTFKPGLPLSLLVLAETPDHKPTSATVRVDLAYTDSAGRTSAQTEQVVAKDGPGLLEVTPPKKAVLLQITAMAGASRTALTMQAGYSPSGSFIHLEQVSEGRLRVGDRAQFHVSSTKEARTFYYEVLARGLVVFSDYTSTPDIEFDVTPQMAPSARLLVYQLLPNAEVAADYMPFDVDGDYPLAVQAGFGREEVRPGDAVDVSVQTDGPARVGLAAVDRSVFILAENRLNLQQVFAELELLYEKPQVEMHPALPAGKLMTYGAADAFRDAGVTALSDQQVPAGKDFTPPTPVPQSRWSGPRQAPLFPCCCGGQFYALFVGALGLAFASGGLRRGRRGRIGPLCLAGLACLAAGVIGLNLVACSAPAPKPQPTQPELAAAATQAPATDQKSGEERGEPTGDLAEVQRVRQFFPETWLWTTLDTDGSGRASEHLRAPDSITTWMLRAVALSKEKGLGIGEAQLRVLQPFFLSVDLPYAVIRGEQFPVKVALYNYTAEAQELTIELEGADWFDLTGEPAAIVRVAANDVGAAEFTIQPRELGVRQVKVTARSRSEADAVVKDLIVEPEGVARESVENLIVPAGAVQELDATIPSDAIQGSGRAYVSLTGNYLTQAIEGLDSLLQMPSGCGEQNMILFAPDVSVAHYLRQTNQAKPEVMARAESLMLTGYQRELTYRRQDGSYSAWGDQDPEGSLWLTAFVLKTFAQAQDLIYVDPDVLDSAQAWLLERQNPDGSFDPYGFIHHKDMLGGLQGKTALTAYLAVALREAGETSGSAAAITYVERAIDDANDDYTLALGAYALALAHSPKAEVICQRLLEAAQSSDQGLRWGRGAAGVETTGYALLAFLEIGDYRSATRAGGGLISQRNAYGGFGSTQDTVVGLQALASLGANARSDVDLTVSLRAGSWEKQARITPESADVQQLFEVPLGGEVSVEVEGTGQVIVQAVRRYNLPKAAGHDGAAFDIEVSYGTEQVAVNDLISVDVDVRYTPPQPVSAGMVVLDVAVPTGFAAETDSIATMMQSQPGIMRYELAGRKVIFYIGDMAPGDAISFSFKARALFPVRAQAVTSTAYAYYQPELKGESLGGELTVGE